MLARIQQAMERLGGGATVPPAEGVHQVEDDGVLRVRRQDVDVCFCDGPLRVGVGNQLYDFLVEQSQVGADDGGEWIEIFNDGSSAIDLSSYSLGWGGDDYTTGTVQLSGNLLPGQYFVVGGPTSDASNGNPVYDQVANFTPNLENSGWFQPADGVALFDVVATSITPTTVPIDAFIYAGPLFSSNSNGLLDESGAPGAVDFVQPFFASGYSVEFDGATWSRQNSPTPNTGTLTPEPSTALCLLLGLCFLGWMKRGRSAT